MEGSEQLNLKRPTPKKVEVNNIGVCRFSMEIEQLNKVPIKEYQLPIKDYIKKELMKRLTDFQKNEVSTYIRCQKDYFSLWQLVKLCLNIQPNEIKTEIIGTQDVYQYTMNSNSDLKEWHVNFADHNLFGFYHSTLYAQDEMQATEIPHLAHIKEKAQELSNTSKFEYKPFTYTGDSPTPILIQNVPRLCFIDTRARQYEPSYYGNGFRMLTKEKLKERITYFDGNSVFVNIIAMAAPAHGKGQYTEEQILFTLITAMISFHCAKIESKGKTCKIHTGNWGTGAFGNNGVLIAIIQILAAEIVEIDSLHYHTFDKNGQTNFQHALELVHKVKSKLLKGDIHTIVKSLVSLGLKWGASNGS